MDCRPAFNFARDAHEVTILPGGAAFRSAHVDLGLATSRDESGNLSFLSGNARIKEICELPLHDLRTNKQIQVKDIM